MHATWSGSGWPPTGTGARPAPAAAGADWRRFASPGPATQRTLGARLVTLVPTLLVGLALLVAALGVVMGSSSLVTLAGATAVSASLAFLAAPILAMKEARRHQRRPPRPTAVPGFSGSGGRAGS
jgi:hypothetical protein